MPNWCINYATLTAPSKDEADRFEAYLTHTSDIDMFNYFRPSPEGDPDRLAAYWTQLKDKGPVIFDRRLTQDELDHAHAYLKAHGLWDAWLPHPDHVLPIWRIEHWGTRGFDEEDFLGRIGHSF